ncbi:MAG: hypothetical protein ABI276_06030 [Acidimicrobiales bacterium]
MPAREVAVRQHSVDNAPVVETSMRVPGGDAVHRAFAVQSADGHVVVVEVENQSSLPFALAWAVRPFTPGAIGRIDEVAVEGARIVVDGLTVALDRDAGRAVAGGVADGDAAAVVFAGEASDATATARCPDGLGQGVAIVAVPHRATVRVALPLDVDEPARGLPRALPSAQDVSSGWSTQVANGVRYELPQGRLTDVAARARRRLLLGATEGARMRPALVERDEPLATVAVIDAMGDMGRHLEAGVLLAAWFAAEPAGIGAVAPALVALRRHFDRTGDVDLVRAAREQLRDDVAVVADRVGRRADLSPALVAWCAAALEAAPGLLRCVGDSRAADDAADAATRAAARRDDVLSAVSAEGPVARSVLAAAAFGALAPTHPSVTRLVAAAANVADGHDVARALDLATIQLANGDPAGYDRLIRVAETASATGVLAPVAPADPDDVVMAAKFLRAVRCLFLMEMSSEELRLCPAPVPALAGQSLEVYGAPVGHRRVSFAVRWHGERPALLWEVEPDPEAVAAHGDVPAFCMTSGLDPDWSSTEPRGEALLAPPRLMQTD